VGAKWGWDGTSPWPQREETPFQCGKASLLLAIGLVEGAYPGVSFCLLAQKEFELPFELHTLFTRRSFFHARLSSWESLPTTAG
jgi:hypothetical protein